MFTPASASAENMTAATPGAFCMPVPTMLTCPRLSCETHSPAPMVPATPSMTPSAARRSLWSTVKERSVSRSALAFWTMVSTLMLDSASGSNTAAAMPGRSGTARSVMRATPRS